VLLVDGRSVWRMLRRKIPEVNENADGPRLAYDELDWEAIQSHPKLAQYRSWKQPAGTDPTGLGILLGSIAERFRQEVALRRGEPLPLEVVQVDVEDKGLDDLSSWVAPEDEDEVEQVQLAREKRRQSARARARRLFLNFVRRFVSGITDSEFVRLVGSSVILPSYVVFNHVTSACCRPVKPKPKPSTVWLMPLTRNDLWRDLQHPPVGVRHDQPKALAIPTVDRLLHHAHVIITEGESQRLVQAMTGKGVMPLN
jgi:hypothetical protein